MRTPAPRPTSTSRPSPTPVGSSPRAMTRGAIAEWATEDPPASFDPARVFEAGLRNHHLANTAYPIAHRSTIWHLRQAPERHVALLHRALLAEGRIGLYAHIPFCERRCSFCEYAVVERHDAELEAAYHAALLREIDLYAGALGPGAVELVGFDLGGGTPSLIDPARIEEIVLRVKSVFRTGPRFGMSIETTPRIAATRPERLAAYLRIGIDRISMGLQMANPRLLAEYGREHSTLDHNRPAVEQIRRAGFRRLNIDLMYGLARQRALDFRFTLEHAISLEPEYITLYRMRYKGTRIRAEAEGVELDRVVEMAELAHELLLAAGYDGSPGKNAYSRVAGDPGTSAYLTERVVQGTPYLGLGLGAQTFMGNLLAYNLGAADKRLEGYLGATAAGRWPIQDLYLLTPAEGMAKMISVSFYFGAIDLDSFAERFGVELADRFPREVAFLLERGVMEIAGRSLRLTGRGAREENGAIALFYSDRVKAHLLSRREKGKA
jgi:oxygen-independent coproporphyrinogen III oxidase